MKRLVLLALSICSLLLLFQCKSSKETIQRTKELVESDTYIFNPSSISSTILESPKSISGYYLIVEKNTIKASLPYAGVSYSIRSALNNDGAIRFTSTKFEYQKIRKKGSWEIKIKILDTSVMTEILLDISESGYASLRIHENDRQSVYFSGIIE